ncbi:ribonuclease h protein [Aphelenchoides avenae]|nr:ribonuclease h protein [Aphelenchus avenae]
MGMRFDHYKDLVETLFKLNGVTTEDDQRMYIMGCIGSEAYSEMRNALHGRDLTQAETRPDLTDFMSEVMDAAPGCDFDKITDANKAQEMMLTQAFRIRSVAVAGPDYPVRNPVREGSAAEKSIAAKGTPGFYAVRYGRVPGVYGSYRELQENTAGYKFAAFKKFDNEGDAWKFVNGEIPISRDPGQTATFYAVQVGRKPGVFRSWDECLKQIEGNPHAIFKKFTDEKAARDFVKGAPTAVNQETRKKV